MSLLIHPKRGPKGGPVGKVHSVAYHRNGVGGEGFYCVQFEHEDRRLLAVVTDQGDDARLNEAYVVTPEHPEQSWRGTDHFGNALLSVIRRSKWPHEVARDTDTPVP